MKLAPIALFVYNRPAHTRQTVEALQKNEFATESELFIFSDAPKKPEAAAAVSEVRQYIRTISGFKSVGIIERDRNWGLANSVIDGVTRLCDEHGRAIVLEDDLLTSTYFLRFMNEALARYQDAPQVMQISGYMFPVKVESGSETFFLPFTTSWGWATWQRAWKYFDPSAAGYQALKNDRAKRKAFDLEGEGGYCKMLESQLRGEIDSWAIRWYLSVFMHNGLVLYPSQALVENTGFDGSGTHCGKHDVAQHHVAGKDEGGMKGGFPVQLTVSASNYAAVVDFMRASNSTGMVNKIKRLFR